MSSCSRHWPAGRRTGSRPLTGLSTRPHAATANRRRLRHDVPSSRLGCSDASRGDGRRSASLRLSPPRSSPVESVTMARGTVRSPFKSLRKNRFAARALRRRWTRMSSTSPASSTARHSQPRFPLIIRQSSSRCQLSEHAPACVSTFGRTPRRTAASTVGWLRARPQSLEPDRKRLDNALAAMSVCCSAQRAFQLGHTLIEIGEVAMPRNEFASASPPSASRAVRHASATESLWGRTPAACQC